LSLVNAVVSINQSLISSKLVHLLPLIGQVHVALAEPAVPVVENLPLEKLAVDTASVFSGWGNDTVVDGNESGGSGDGDSGRGRIGGLGELVASSSHVLYVFGYVVVLVQLLFWTSLSLMAVW
jgi:hypothetical protein